MYWKKCKSNTYWGTNCRVSDKNVSSCHESEASIIVGHMEECTINRDT